ncbi:MAG TPA: HAD family hydrolase [Firmicutes bacterium]|nr:HAD family hydrolase [Candidatus Fermentithermobacillaceae bacterium]
MSSGHGVKLLACDLDGTLIGPGGKGIDTAKEALDLCRAEGIRVTVATGRVFGAVERFLWYLDLQDPVITNGGAIISVLGGEPLLMKTISKDLAEEIVLEIRKMGLPFYYLLGKNMLSEWNGPETENYSKNLDFEIKIVDSVLKTDDEPTQIVLRVPSEQADALVAILSSKWYPRVEVVKSLPGLIEIQPRGVSKGKALQVLCRIFDINREEVLAIGDSLNDLDMLSWAGKKACVGNAHPLVKRSVQITAKGELSEGVLEIVENLIKGNV